jgi:hypothetical protein
VTAADAQVGGGQRHRHHRLAEVELSPAELVIGRGADHRDGGRGSGYVSGAPPDPGQLAEPGALGDQDEVPWLPVLRGRGPAAGLQDLVQVRRRYRLAGERPHVAARGNSVPGLHECLTSPAAP